MTIRHILTPLTLSEKRKLLLFALGNATSNLFDILSLVFLLYMVNLYTSGPAAGIAAYLPSIHQTENRVLLIFAFLAFFAAKNYLAYWLQKKHFDFIYAAAARIANENLLHYLEGSYADYVMIDSSVWTRRISQQPIEYAHYILSGLQQIFTETVMITITILVILLYKPLMFLLLLLILVPALILVSWLAKKQLKMIRNRVKTDSELAMQYLNESLNGFVESNIYSKQDFFVNRFSSYQEKMNRTLAALQSVQYMPGRLVEMFAIFGFCIFILLNIFSGNGELISFVTIGAFMGAAYKIIPGIVKIQNVSAQMKTYAFVLKDLLIVSEKPARAEHLPQLHSIQFDKVSFQHLSGIQIPVTDVLLAEGTFLGINGDSGIGKTTILNLLLGFCEPVEGKILFNGKNVEAEDRKQFWPRIAYVKQGTFLLNGSVLSNIVFDENDYDQDRLSDVLKATGLDKVLALYPEGLQKRITENGKNISGGQRQRIVIARALYKISDLLLLDEPFNELDADSEIAILKYLQTMVKSGKMVVLVTHNRESLSYCNKIVSLHAAE